MKRIVIDVYDEKDGKLNGLIDIRSNEYGFSYGNDITGHGLQCKHDSESNEYRKLMFRLDRITDLVRKIEGSEGI
ncbi:hypothetical protein DW1_1126 [Proteiniborus sp. DW1]|uniref:hypothetical protein n=1 Tax=Proteiniborus sp. DW1 TaxID=1889883 RepID=UPI00092E0845|nr:hypothetical protein [Proteiniborus sp. DW1]SCG82699.1 hypothetical protein DW1_1126 [Proteiniborus sp. DW1]